MIINVEIMKTKLLAICLSIATLIILVASCSKKVSKSKKNIPIAVSVARVIKKTMPYTLDLAGTTEVYKSVEIKPLVSGQISRIYFDDGQDVKAGDLLFKIDDRDFRYRLAQAEANLLRDQVAFLNAIKDEERYRELLKVKAVSTEDYEQKLTNKDTLNAAVVGDNAAIMDAKLQIEYSAIVAPISGKIGEALISEGDMVYSGGTSSMVVINRIAPIYATLFVPERYLSVMKQSQSSNDLSIQLKTAEGGIAENGQVDFIDNAIDKATGTIKVRALFPNIDETLWPGQFVKVTLNLYEMKDVLVVPDKAVQTNQGGQYVFVVGDESKVEIRPIEVEFSGDGYSVAKSGLKEGEIVVTTGQLRLVVGSKVVAE